MKNMGFHILSNNAGQGPVGADISIRLLYQATDLFGRTRTHPSFLTRLAFSLQRHSDNKFLANGMATWPWAPRRLDAFRPRMYDQDFVRHTNGLFSSSPSGWPIYWGVPGVYYQDIQLTASGMTNQEIRKGFVFTVVDLGFLDAYTGTVTVGPIGGMIKSYSHSTQIIMDAPWDEYLSAHIGSGTFDTFGEGVRLTDQAIDTSKFAPGAIDAAAIANAAIDAATFAAGAIDANAIATDAIDADAIAANAIGSSEIADGAITNMKFAAGAIDAAAIATDAIDADAIATDAIGSDELADGAITNTKFAAGAITNTTFAAGAIDAAAIATDAIDADAIAAGAIDASAIATDAIDADAIATAAIDAMELGSLAAEEIADHVWDRLATDHEDITNPQTMGARVAALTAVLLKKATTTGQNMWVAAQMSAIGHFYGGATTPPPAENTEFATLSGMVVSDATNESTPVKIVSVEDDGDGFFQLERISDETENITINMMDKLFVWGYKASELNPAAFFDALLVDHDNPGTFGDALIRMLGLRQHNMRIRYLTHNSAGIPESGVIYIYANAADCAADTNTTGALSIGSYAFDATFDPNDLSPSTYRTVKVT
jgi:hypothetical protein